MPCASSPAVRPASTSPVPPVASHAGALALMTARPPGSAMTVRSFQNNHRPATAGSAARAFKFAALFATEQPYELAFVGCDDARAVQRLEQHLRRLGKHGERVGIEYQGTAGTRCRRAHRVCRGASGAVR